jgi:hypothetical protein
MESTEAYTDFMQNLMKRRAIAIARTKQLISCVYGVRQTFTSSSLITRALQLDLAAQTLEIRLVLSSKNGEIRLRSLFG